MLYSAPDRKFTAITQVSLNSTRAALDVLLARLIAWVGHMAPDRHTLDGALRLILRVALAVFATELEMQVYQVQGELFPDSQDSHLALDKITL